MAHVSSNPPPPVSLQPLDRSLSLMAQSKAIKNTCKQKLRTWKSAGNSRRYALCVDYSFSGFSTTAVPFFVVDSAIESLRKYLSAQPEIAQVIRENNPTNFDHYRGGLYKPVEAWRTRPAISVARW